jgi:tetratricopeptide (TPR) repeat protein
MTLQRPNTLLLIAVGVAFAVALAVFSVANRPGVVPASHRGMPTDPNQRALLADSYLQRVRETGDASYYVRAAGILRGVPRAPAVLTTLGTLALARHDFRGGLRYGLAAHRAAPLTVKPLGVIVDAQVELGRYSDAARTLQRMLDEKPSLASYARVSYFRELHGDLDGAVRAMRLAVSAGGVAAENVAYVQTLLGQLEYTRGRLGAARLAYRQALYRFPRYAPAEVGLARVDAAQRRLGPAIARLRAVVDRLPLPEYVVALGETELAAARAAQARHDLALVGVEERLLHAAGVNTDTELALYEADHGAPARALVLARRAWQDAPSVRSADALGWALTSAGRPRAAMPWAGRALRLGSRDPMFLYHAGIAAQRAGRFAEARRRLTAALALNRRFNPLYAPRAQRALRSLR